VSETVTVRALATLAPFAPPNGVVAFTSGQTAGEVVRGLGIDLAAIATVLRNGRPASLDARLAPGDVLSLVPPITGG